jgi:CubicO group peptidase (beta-lactamase class C family)
MNRRSLLLGAGAATLAACATPSASTEASLAFADELDGHIRRGMERLGTVPGLSVAVYSPDGVFTRGYGVTDVNTGQSADADTSFYIASSTKPLTSLMLLRLAARGEFDLDAKLAAYAPDAPFAAAARASEVSFRNLLSHTSGISNDAIATRVAYTGQHDPETLWRLLGDCTANAEAPLGAFQYTNTGYNIATVLTDRRIGTPWQDLLQTEVFDALGMRRTSAKMSRAVAGGWKVAKPHMSLPEGITKVYLEKVDATMQSAGGVIMSANDAVPWLELMIEEGVVRGRRVLPATSIEATRAPLAQTAEGTEFAGYGREAYGLGWYRGPYRDEVMYHHFGGFTGARAHVSYIPARRIGVAAFVNDSGVSPVFTDAVANFVYDRSAGRDDAVSAFDAKLEALVQRRDQLFQRITANRAERAARPWTLTRAKQAYAGAYENRQFGRMEITADGDHLNVSYGVLHSTTEPFTQPDSIRVELLPNSGEAIVFQGDGAQPNALRYNDQTYERV